MSDPEADGGWIAPRLASFGSCIGALVPTGFASYLRIAHDDADPGASGVPRALLEPICQHLSRDPGAGDCRIALCDVHGWTGASVSIGWPAGVPVDWAAIRAAEEEAARPAFEPDVLHGPKLHLPYRDYMLFAGPIGAALAFPDYLHRPVGPDLLWPQSRTWFVATDVDLDFSYVGGSQNLVADLAADARLATEVLDADKPLEPDEDR